MPGSRAPPDVKGELESIELASGGGLRPDRLGVVKGALDIGAMLDNGGLNVLVNPPPRRLGARDPGRSDRLPAPKSSSREMGRSLTTEKPAFKSFGGPTSLMEVAIGDVEDSVPSVEPSGLVEVNGRAMLQGLFPC